MTRHVDRLRQILSQGPSSASRIGVSLGVSQQSVSRAVLALGDDVVRLGAARSTQYVLRDTRRGLPTDLPVYQVNDSGQLVQQGRLLAVLPEGYVMQWADGQTTHHEGLPWWVADMRATGFLGRAWAARHAVMLGLSPRLTEWSDADHLRALLAHGHDAVGHLLLGEGAHERHLTQPAPVPIEVGDRGVVYARLAAAASRGEQPGSSAGGEQPKFTAFTQTSTGEQAHVIVKFTLLDRNPITERWADLLLAEHHALETLREAGISAAKTEVLDHGGQRFLQSERFDRVGALGRRAMWSLASLDAEFAGAAPAPWPVIVERLAVAGHVAAPATAQASLLYAFGVLIGNTDMHPGNLSFTGEQQPYVLAPAYDMLPMGFAPTAGGALPETLTAPVLRSVVGAATWRQAFGLANHFLSRVQAERRWSVAWQPCVAALVQHLQAAQQQLSRLA